MRDITVIPTTDHPVGAYRHDRSPTQPVRGISPKGLAIGSLLAAVLWAVILAPFL